MSGSEFFLAFIQGAREEAQARGAGGVSPRGCEGLGLLSSVSTTTTTETASVVVVEEKGSSKEEETIQASSGGEDWLA